MSDEVSTTAR